MTTITEELQEMFKGKIRCDNDSDLVASVIEYVSEVAHGPSLAPVKSLGLSPEGVVELVKDVLADFVLYQLSKD